MADRSRLPDKKLLDKLYEKILGPEEEMDEVSLREGLADYGLTPEEAIADVRVRLEKEIQDLRAKGSDVPPVLIDALASLQKSEEPKSENIAIDADDYVDDLLEGRIPGGAIGANQTSPLHAFRGLNTESLSEEDRQILERVEAELEAEDEQEEG